ncbi:hypothetical protein SLEP1_g23324 [Rubroshorea leprosula]|uniref:Uncharacterized protein n=1 Tax=Rubroshorea leprosula TaxID=152421 RepID=A0AAV5JL85_9ROSI|nr:hypothetical protein SLEP1_g23324 [Rubroshorea leprosula]
MVRRRAKKTAKQAPKLPEHLGDGDTKESQNEEKDKVVPLIHQEVERQIAAIRAIRDVDIEHMLTSLRLLRSYFSEEQCQTPVLQFFKESLPNLSVVRSEVNGEFHVQYKNEDGNLFMNHLDHVDLHASLLRRLSMAQSHCSGIPSFGGFDLSSSRAVRASFLGADNLQIKDLVLEGLQDSQVLGMHDSLRTPGASSQRLSIGLTPKTLRVPKPGEMLLSVHGSPLGVYKEDNMEAIHESEEG